MSTRNLVGGLMLTALFVWGLVLICCDLTVPNHTQRALRDHTAQQAQALEQP